MGRSPCCDNSVEMKKGPWTPDEDEKLVSYIQEHGHGSWRALPKLAGLKRCGKSCRLRWTNYLRPDIKRGQFSKEEEELIIKLHSVLGNKWSKIATHLPGRTDNEIKNYWNTHVRKKLLGMGIDPVTHRPRTDLNNFLGLGDLSQLISNPTTAAPTYLMNNNPLEQAAQLAKLQVLQSLLHILNTSAALPSLEQANPFGFHNFNQNYDQEIVKGLVCCSSSMDNSNVPGEAGTCFDIAQSRLLEAETNGVLYNKWGGNEHCGNGAKVCDCDGHISLDIMVKENSKINPALVTMISPETSTSNPIGCNTNSSFGLVGDDFFEGLEKLLDGDKDSWNS
ncbi:hypothetical protein Dimus_007905 [Dionaea muscipula]